MPDSLIHRCQQGELAAFSELFQEHEAQAYRLALTILRHEQDAQDAVQDAFLRVFENIKRFEGNSSFKTWFTRIVVNICRDRIRRNKVRRAFSLDWLRNRPSPHNVAREVARRQERQALWSFVDRLDEKYRLPIILHYYERLSCSEVAEILDIPTTTVYSRLNTARQQLRTMAALDTAGIGREAEQGT
jgi:RNA polymerase sigma-70 factor (ECF subfamily)